MIFGPWKRAAEAETRAALAEAKVPTLEGQLVQAHEVIRELSAMIGNLKREGFQMPPAQPQAPPPSEQLPDAVVEAMAERASPNSQAWHRLGAEARKLLRHGDADAVAKKILEGEQSFRWDG